MKSADRPATRWRPPMRSLLALVCGIVALGLPVGVEAWTRQASATAIELRIPPESRRPPTYFSTTEICKNVTTHLTNITSLVCQNVTREIQPPLPPRGLPKMYVSDFDKKDSEGAMTKWVALGCWRHYILQSKGGYTNMDLIPGAVRANVSCYNATDENETMAWWECEGGLSPDDDDTPFTGLTWDPVNCTAACAIHDFPIAAMNGVECWCLKKPVRATMIKETAINDPNSRFKCSTPCADTYFNATSKFCGGPSHHYSLYQQYDTVHQTGQGCLDPFRRVWYMVVAIEERVSHDIQGGGFPWDKYPDRDEGQMYGNWTTGYTWFLHATSTDNGEPQFPYNLELNGPLYGIQYDLDNSSIYGVEVPYWDQVRYTTQDRGSEWVRLNRAWTPVLVRFEIDSNIALLASGIGVYWYPKDIIGNFPDEQALYSQAITTLDSINNIYFIAVPQVKYPFKEYNDYTTKIYGFDTSGNNQKVGNKAVLSMNEATNFGVVDLMADSRTHSLYATLTIPGARWRQPGNYFVKLGHSFMSIRWPTNPFDPIITSVSFFWTFVSPGPQELNFTLISQSIVNEPLYVNDGDNLDGANLSMKFYQIGSGGNAIDAETNSSFVLYKDQAATTHPFLIKNVKYKHTNFTYNRQDAEPYRISNPPKRHWSYFLYKQWEECCGFRAENSVAAPVGVNFVDHNEESIKYDSVATAAG